MSPGLFHDPLAESGNFRPVGPTLGADDVIAVINRDRYIKGFDQQPAGEIGFNQDASAQRHALSVDRRLDHHGGRRNGRSSGGVDICDAGGSHPIAPFGIGANENNFPRSVVQ